MQRRSDHSPFLFPHMFENPWPSAGWMQASSKLKRTTSPLSCLEVCAGGGGQALGLEQAGIEHVGLIELEKTACETLRLNRPDWNVVQTDLNHLDGSAFRGVDVISGGLPCPPFSVAGKQLGRQDERNLFPAM